MTTDLGSPAGDPDLGDERSALDRSSLEALYRTQAPKLALFFRRWSASRDDAQDLVHDAFVRLSGRAAPNGPEAYLGRIAVNLLRDRSRSAFRLADRQSRIANTILLGVDPHAQLEARDMLHRLEDAMLQLKPKTREIFMAHRLDGLSYAEIADRTGLSIKGVEKQMSRAIAKLDRLMGRR